MASKADKFQVYGDIQGNFRCMWTIERFSSLNSQVGKDHQSENLQLQENGIEWYLKIYPGGASEIDGGHVSCFVFCRNATVGVKFKYRLSLRNTDGAVLFDGVCDEWITLTTQGYGYAKTMEAKHLKPELVNDTLVVALEATYCSTCVGGCAGTYRRAEVAPTAKIIDDLRYLWQSKENADSALSVETCDIPVHSAVLAARSEVFATMFKRDMLAKGSRSVKVTGFKKEVVDSMVEFIYCGSVRNLDCDLALELLQASEKYELEDLKSYCSNYLISVLNVKNVCHILLSADICNAEELLDQAMKYFRENLSEDDFEIQRPLFKKRPELVYDIVKGFMRKESDLTW